MASFDSLFQKDRDLIRETGAQPGNLLQVNDAGTDLVPYDLVSGTGATEIITETTSTNQLVFVSYVEASGASGTEPSKVTYTSTGVDLTGMFNVNDLVYFTGNFTDATLLAKYGAGDTAGFTFAFPIASTGIQPAAGKEAIDPWTFVIDLNRAPFATWTDGATINLVKAETGVTISGSNLTQTFFTDVVASGGLNVSLRTTTTVSEVGISQYADGDLEIAGINADGVVVNLTEGDFGTAGQSVLVNSTADGLVFGAAVPELGGTADPQVQQGTDAIKIWTGTKNDYDVLVANGTTNPDTIYNITDDGGTGSGTFGGFIENQNTATSSTAMDFKIWAGTLGEYNAQTSNGASETANTLYIIRS